MEQEIKELIIEDIQNKAGYKIQYAKDCDRLSADLVKETGKYLSPSTLKRFFGIVKTSFKPSKYTVNTLMAYLGFSHLEAYIDGFDQSIHLEAGGDSWSLLKKRFQLITRYSLETLHLKTGYDQRRFVPRSIAPRKINDFLASQKPATLFVAPDGYGKSSLLIELVENYFANEKAFANDIVCLIDGSTYFGLYAKNNRVELLNQLFDFQINHSLYYFFRKNPGQLKGRIWLIVDEVDEIFLNKSKFQHLVENLIRITLVHAETSWFKMLFTCRPENVEVFSWFARKNPYLKELWHDVNFSGQITEAINIPLLTREEIELALQKSGFQQNLDSLEKNHPRVAQIIDHPGILSFFIEEYKSSGRLSYYHLLSRYVSNKLFSPPYRDEKLLVLSRFFEHCNRALETDTVPKELLPDLGMHVGYRELISCGLLYEYTIPENITSGQVFVRFRQKAIFEFVLLNIWLKEEAPGVELFLKIRQFYSSNVALQCNLIQLYVKYLAAHNHFTTIIELHRACEKEAGKGKKNLHQLSPCMRAVAAEVTKESTQLPGLKKRLDAWVANSPLGKTLYKPTDNET